MELPRGWDYPTAAGARPPFCHGVASGDPSDDRVVIWTRLTLPEPPRSPVQVRRRLGRDRRLRDVVARGTVAADAARDWTVGATLEQWFVPHLEPSDEETLGARFTVARGTNHATPAP